MVGLGFVFCGFGFRVQVLGFRDVVAQALGVPSLPFEDRCQAFAGMDVSIEGRVEKKCTNIHVLWFLSPKPSLASGSLHHYLTQRTLQESSRAGTPSCCNLAKTPYQSPHCCTSCIWQRKSYESLILFNFKLLTRTPYGARDAPINLSQSLRSRVFYDRLPSRRGHVALPCN